MLMKLTKSSSADEVHVFMLSNNETADAENPTRITTLIVTYSCNIQP